MQRDPSVREVIVYTLRMKTVLLFAKFGPQYLQSADKNAGEQILLKYGEEFPDQVTPSMYDQIFDRFLKHRPTWVKEKFLSNS